MTVRDLDRIVTTREPVMANQRVCRLVAVTISWTPGGVTRMADVIDRNGRRFLVELSELQYLDGRVSK